MFIDETAQAAFYGLLPETVALSLGVSKDRLAVFMPGSDGDTKRSACTCPRVQEVAGSRDQVVYELRHTV